MSKTVSTKRTSSVFLAAILAAGTIAEFSPSFMVGTAQAEPYYGMDSYDKNQTEKTSMPNLLNATISM